MLTISLADIGQGIPVTVAVIPVCIGVAVNAQCIVIVRLVVIPSGPRCVLAITVPGPGTYYDSLSCQSNPNFSVSHCCVLRLRSWLCKFSPDVLTVLYRSWPIDFFLKRLVAEISTLCEPFLAACGIYVRL